ncbi:hypothetical protein ACEUDN_09795 [Aeromonas hydrophila]|uniref:hypothetical protein n=1 Tax=Aeromonas hydrophila TaxID=644 RepID=UPI0038D159D8
MSEFENAISTLLLGFVLGQAIDFTKYRWGIYRKKRAISDEVWDICENFKEKASRVKTILRETNTGEVRGTSIPACISRVIFDHHYAEVAPFFTRKERAELTVIYKCVENFNETLSTGVYNNLVSSNESMLSLYYQSRMGCAAIEYYLAHKGKKCINDNKEELEKIRVEIQELVDKYHI